MYGLMSYNNEEQIKDGTWYMSVHISSGFNCLSLDQCHSPCSFTPAPTSRSPSMMPPDLSPLALLPSSLSHSVTPPPALPYHTSSYHSITTSKLRCPMKIFSYTSLRFTMFGWEHVRQCRSTSRLDFGTSRRIYS